MTGESPVQFVHTSRAAKWACASARLCRAAGGPRGACGAVAAVQQNGPVHCLCTPLCGAAGGPYEVVLAAVQHDGDALQLPSADLQEDRAIVLAAVQRHGDALYYALTTPLQR